MWNFTKFGKNSHFSTSVVWKNWNSSSCGEIPCIEIWNFSTWQISSPPTCRWSRWQISGMAPVLVSTLWWVWYVSQIFQKFQVLKFKFTLLRGVAMRVWKCTEWCGHLPPHPQIVLIHLTHPALPAPVLPSVLHNVLPSVHHGSVLHGLLHGGSVV